MSKKKKKKASSDDVRNKRKEKDHVKKTNPFEVKVNRQKFNVLGRKIGKHEKGMPGVSRSKATKKRKETLLQEYKYHFKSNKFVDKRIGENDPTLSLEDKMMKRFALERVKSEKANKFNLNEDEELTHYGQSLAEIEKFEDPKVSDDEDDDDDDRRAAAKLVAEQHFGGFLKKKTDTEESTKTWKERMEEMISQSKKEKHERQVEKEKSAQMTDEVDEQWKELAKLMAPLKKDKGKPTDLGEQSATGDGENDDYDIAVRELMFATRGKPTDRLKTEEELAKEEKERLEKLEADRLRRMRGITEEETYIQPKYRSADDLDDGFAIDTSDFDYVSYKDGKLLQEEDSEEDNKLSEDDQHGDDDDDEEGSDKNEHDEEEEGEEQDDEADEDASNEDKDNSGKGSDAESDDSYNDLMSDEEDDREDEDAEVKPEDSSSKKKKKGSKIGDKPAKKDDKKLKEEMIETAKKELPYTFEAPKTYDDLLDVLEGHDLEDQLTIIDRIRKCHHPSLAEGNKQKLETLFSHLIEFFGDLCIQDPPQLEFADRLTKHLFELTQLSPLAAAQAIVNNITDRQEEFRQICERKGGRGLYPGLDTLMLLKLIAVLFPTSDFQHPVTTPSLMFMCQILSCSPVNHGRDVAAGLFLCNLCLEYVSLSKRYIPEVINFLQGIMFLAIAKESGKIEPVVPPFKPVGKHINLLHIFNKVDSGDSRWSMSKMLAPEVDSQVFDTDSFKVAAVHQCLVLLEEFSKLYVSLPSYREIFTPVLCICEKLPKEMYPESVQYELRYFMTRCQGSCEKKRSFLVMQKKKPKPLKMFEPKMEERFDGRKKRHGTRDFIEKQRLLHKHKKEMKGARREIRKDNRFLARQQLQEQLEKDTERKRKVKELYHMMAVQEADYKKMKRGHVT